MIRFLAALVAHTPIAVWIGLAVLIVVGLVQARPRRVSGRRLVVLPGVLVILSLASAWHTFAAGGEARVLAAWLAGLAAGLLLGRAAAQPGVVANADGSYQFPGSYVPLALMLAIFAVRYVVNVVLAVAPGFALQPAFTIGACIAYGVPSGLFAARARQALATRAGGAATGGAARA